MSDSHWPTSASLAARPKRPTYFVLVLTLVSLVGLFGWTEGCQTIRTLHDPNGMKAAAERITDIQVAHWEQVLIDSTLAHHAQTWPLALGQFLLGLMLWLTALALLFGRGQLRGLLLQAMGAYGAFLCVSFLLRAPLRNLQLEALLAGDLPTVEGQTREQVMAMMRVLVTWAARGALGFQLAVLAGGVLTLTRPRVRAWLGGATAHEGDGRET